MTSKATPWAVWGKRHVQTLMIFLCFVEAYILVSGLSVAVVAMADDKNLYFPDSGQSLVLSAFLWGFFLSPMAGGLLAHWMGAKRLLFFSILISSILSLLLPVAADWSWKATCAVRVAQGLAQGVLAPGAHALLAQWAPPVERARLGSFVYGGAQLGTMFGLLLSGFLSDSSWAWPSVFYVSGALGLVWCVAWFVLGANSPSEHPSITEKERNFIESQTSNVSAKTRVVSTPWCAILKSGPLWGLTAAHCGQMVGYWTLLTQLPSYMKNVQGFDIKQNGLVTALPYFAMWVAALPLSWVSDVLVQSGRASTTVMRKIANTIAQWGGGAVLVVLGCGVADDDSTLTVGLLTLAMTLLASMYLGFQINHLDISPNHAPALMGFTNLWANLLSVLGPIVTPLVVTDEHSAPQWHIVFLAAGILFLVANLLFVVIGSAVVQPWNELGLEELSPELGGVGKTDTPDAGAPDKRDSKAASDKSCCEQTQRY